MKSFRFPLEKALEWRQKQLQLAEARVQEQLATLATIDQALSELDAMGHRTEIEVRQFPLLVGGDLGALSYFRLAIKGRGKELAARRVQGEKELAVRQGVLLEARRRSRLLEKLKGRRQEEWQTAANRELDELAADSYLAQWARRRTSSL
jgi:hypothetical protein